MGLQPQQALLGALHQQHIAKLQGNAPEAIAHHGLPLLNGEHGSVVALAKPRFFQGGADDLCIGQDQDFGNPFFPLGQGGLGLRSPKLHLRQNFNALGFFDFQQAIGLAAHQQDVTCLQPFVGDRLGKVRALANQLHHVQIKLRWSWLPCNDCPTRLEPGGITISLM
jgi:hypothetical protein